MANNVDDYLTEYRKFFEHFAQTVNPNEQLPVKLGGYKFLNVEVVGGIIDWTTQYLVDKQCPKSLVSPLIRIVIDEMRNTCRKHPLQCGFNPSDDAYEPLKLMQSVIVKVNEICQRYLDNSMLCTLPSPGPPHHVTSVSAIKNSRRRMEDRHIILNDLSGIFSDQDSTPSSYYAIFDGHAGHDAAAYSAAHLHQFLAESKHFDCNPEQALKDAFRKTDELFLQKCKIEKFNSGTTAVCALLRVKEKTLYIAWAGDSQALLANQGRILQCVNPHKPCRRDEKLRIEEQGGVVVLWGTWRVDGQLAVSRAIGDSDYKPYVTAEPDVREIPLTGTEDFLIIGSDGLWDHVSEEDAAMLVYKLVHENPDDYKAVSARLIQLARNQLSSDNISVIVVFLREPSKIAAEAHWAARNTATMEAGLDNANAANNPFTNTNGSDALATQKDQLFNSYFDGFKANGTAEEEFFKDIAKNGRRSAGDVFGDDDLGPETDVDAADDGAPVPSPKQANNPFSDYCGTELEEKVAMGIDMKLQKHEVDLMEGEKTPREETPTPPAEEVYDGGLVDNVAESGDESEDGWNYYKGGADKENIPPSRSDREVADITGAEPDQRTNAQIEEEEAMSQLNPDAAEFVPISPTRVVESPICTALKGELMLAQSPKRGSHAENVDINLPSPQDFEKEVKSRPSEIFSNGHENGHKSSSVELMENLLNGKNIDEIEFQPNSTPKKVPNEEFHFGPNATPFSTPAKNDQSALSTKANFGDDTTASYMEEKGFDNDSTDFQSFKKEQDPMSMSFYQDKDDNSEGLDLDRVQMIPDNIDDFIEKVEENICDEKVTDLDKHDDLLLGVCKLPKSPCAVTPEPTLDENLCALTEKLPQSDDFDKIMDFCGTTIPAEIAQTPEEDAPSQLDELSSQSGLLSPEPIAPELPKSCELKSPEPELCAETPEPELSEKSDLDYSNKSPAPECPIKSPEPAVCPMSPEAEECALKSPEPSEISAKSPVPSVHFDSEVAEVHDIISQKSPEPEVCAMKTPEPEVCQMKSPEPELCPMKSPEPEVCQMKSPELEVCQMKSPEPEICQMKSPEPELCPMKTPEPEVSQSESPEPKASEFDVDSEIICKSEPEACPMQFNTESSAEPELDSVQSPEPEICVLKSPEPEICTLKSPEPEICVLKSPEPEMMQSPEPNVVLSPEPELVCATSPELVCAKSPELVCASPEVLAEPQVINDSCAFSPEPVECPMKISEPVESPILEAPKSPELSAASPEPSTEEICAKSPEVPAVEEQPLVCSLPIGQMKLAEIEAEHLESPHEDVTSSVKDDEPLSPLESDAIVHMEDGKMEEPVTMVCEAMEVPPQTEQVVTEPKAEEPAIVEEVKQECLTDLTSVEQVMETPVKDVEIVPVPQEQEKTVEDVMQTATVAAASAIAAAAAVAAKTSPKPKISSTTTAATKKPTATKTATSPTKTATAKPKIAPITKPSATKPATATKTSSLTKTAAPARPLASTRTTTAAAKPKTSTTTTSKPLEKKLVNGDSTAAPKTTLAARKPAVPSTLSKTTTAKTAAAPGSKTSLSKTATGDKPSTTRAPMAARPTGTASARSNTVSAPKPRPNTLATKTTTAAKSVPSTLNKTTVTKTATSPSAAARPKPASSTLSAASKPRVPLSSRPAAKAPDAEKQNKENVNKLTASRTSTSKTTLGSVNNKTSTVRKEAKTTTGTLKTTTTKTTTSTTKTPPKKPLSTAVRKSASPTKTTTTTTTSVTKVSKPKENGIPNGVITITEEINTTNVQQVATTNGHDDFLVVKDQSPIVEDNSIIIID